MKLLLPLLIISASSLYAQKEIPGFGQFTGEELSMKECDFDKEAEAVVLFDIASSNYGDDYNLITTHRIRFKILKDKGIDRANIEIPYYSKDNFENISNIEAITRTLADNGNVVVKELDKKTIFRQKINEFFSAVKFTVPNAKTGTLIEYTYVVNAKNYNGLKDWYFQSELPTVISRYDLTVIPNAEFTYLVHKSHALPVKISNDKVLGSIRFEMDNIAGLRDEPFMDAPKDYLQYVEFQLAGYMQFGSKVKYMTTWKEAARELMSAYYFGKQLEKSLPASEEIINKANALAGQLEKMKFIYDFVCNNFTWNHINSKFTDDGIKNVWTSRQGTNGEINLILLNLLKQAGLQADPMLVSERDHGKVNTDYPIIDQFSKTVAYVDINGRKYVLDATDSYTPVNLIPFSILNTNAFIVNSKNPVVMKLVSEKGASNFINIYLAISDNSELSGNVTVHSYYYAKAERVKAYRKDTAIFQRNYFERNFSEIKIDSFEVSHAETDSLPLSQSFVFAIPPVNADYKLLNTNIFSDIEKNPFILDNRFTDVDFGCLRRTDINETFELPPDLKAENIPKDAQLITPDKSISFARFSTLENNMVTVQMSLKINKTIFTTDEYPLLKEFYKKMYNMLSEQIVLRRK